MSKLSEYLNVSEDYHLPDTMQAVVLTGVGEQNIELSTVDVPECGDNQLLARVDAAIACASDNKLIDQGSEHPLMYGWDVSKYPIIIGHEGSVTIVKVGKKLQDRFRPGQRFAIQPAVPTGPRHYRERYRNNAEGVNKIALGYTLPGLFAEYVLISEEVIETGCLIPFPRDIPYFGAALAEPLSCVIAAQERIVHIIKENPSSPRRAVIGPKKGGVTLIIGAGPMGLMHIEVAMSYKPSKIIVSEVLEERRKNAMIFLEKAKNLGISMILTEPNELREVINRETDGKGVDDVIVALGIAQVQEESIGYLAKGGVTVFFGGTSYKDRMIQLDTHRVHYDGVTAVGSSGSDPSDVARALEMISDGTIDPGNYVVKCGGLDAAISLLRDVRNQKIYGKGVIYPHTRSLLFDIKAWNLAKERDYMEKNLL
ncbi:MAG: zinc-binding dehydrogenase [Candidatus Bathyarchaeia archaeon]